MGKVSEATKRKIADCFIKLVEDSPDPRRRVSVTAIIKDLGIDRKTFYNHFDSTTDLVVWIYRSELAEKLKGREFFNAELDYPDESLRDKYADLPCYARFLRDDGLLDQRMFYRSQCAVLNSRHEYYRHIFTHPCYIDFYRYGESLSIPLIKKDILIMLGPDRSLPEEVVDFLAEYHTCGLWGRVPHYFRYRKELIPVEGLDRLWNYAHTTLKINIDSMCEKGRL